MKWKLEVLRMMILKVVGVIELTPNAVLDFNGFDETKIIMIIYIYTQSQSHLEYEMITNCTESYCFMTSTNCM